MDPFRLLGQRRFGPYFAVQFLGAFNDNVFKTALFIVLSMAAVQDHTLNANLLINIAAGVFILPFVLCSAYAGMLADSMNKATLIRYIKLAEILLMIGVATAFYFHALYTLIMLLFLLGTQSAFFGPVKYSLLPQVLHMSELTAGNALIEMSTFIAIILGTVMGGFLIALPFHGPLYVSLITILTAIIGWGASLAIPPLPVAVIPDKAAPQPNSTWAVLKLAKSRRTIFLTILGISWFWFYGAIFLTQFPNYTLHYLKGTPQVTTILLATFSIGIGLGALLCNRLSHRKIELGLVPIGAIGLTIFALHLANVPPLGTSDTLLTPALLIHQTTFWKLLLDVCAIGISGGLYIVPLYAFLQFRSTPEHRARTIAANNIINALFMVAASLFAITVLSAGFSIPTLFSITAAISIVVAFYIFYLLPEFLMRFIAWLLVHTVYKVQYEDLHHIPATGPAVLACNHISFADPLILTAACRRPIRFVMDYEIYHFPLLHTIFKLKKAIPVAPEKQIPGTTARAFNEVAEALSRGELVCIFPEGGISRDGEIKLFKRGIGRIIEQNPVPVIPMALQGMWGSFFSRRYGKAMRFLPKKIRAKIGITAGEPIAPTDFDLQALEARVRELRGDWW